ncbi:MAG: DUF1080 domain-containing protein [Ferruginibacter sp.]
MNRYTVTVFLFLSLSGNASAQGHHFIFSAIKGTVSKQTSTKLPKDAAFVKWVEGDSSFFKIELTNNKQLKIAFQPSNDFIGVATAKAQVKNTSGNTILDLDFTGISTKGLEGENEPPLSRIVDALGYSANIGWNALANNTLPELQGDEISFAVFHKAKKGKVEMIPVARYSPDFELPFGYYTDKSEKANKHYVGTLSKAGKFPEHQCLFPSVSAGGNSFDPGDNAFGFYADGPTHTAYSEDSWNMLIYPGNAVHATRIYPLKDKAGKPVSHTYLVCFEEAKNGDYNDYVFVVKNITPVTKDPFINLFNGNDLSGWHTFLRGIGSNKDPNNNFKVEDGVLHVIGKDLGYAITKKSFHNYHFKVAFKWGERRWPPRENEKRDAGICYNIPVNEPDSIWPQSIECQVQEGDVGDFWLLGFSTIKVNGVQNMPSAHTRMIKQKDAEKPYGEWNTVEVISYKGKCVHIVNGVVVNAGEDASVKEGRILLQSEYAEVYYRNPMIQKL